MKLSAMFFSLEERKGSERTISKSSATVRIRLMLVPKYV